MNQFRYSPDVDVKARFLTVQDYENAVTAFYQWKTEADEELMKIPPKERFPYYDKETQKYTSMISGPCPDVLIAICPMCERNVYARMRSGLFTLNSWFWVMEYDNGKTVTDDSICEHLFLVDGALNLNNKPVPEKIKPYSFIREKIYMGAEVPFIKPRILSKEGVIAVFHSITIAEKYTAYPVTYFSKFPIPQREFGTGWAREEYCARSEIMSEVTFSGSRKEPQDYDFEPWVKSGKIQWLVLQKNEFVLNSPQESMPYANLTGRRNPYIVKEGKILDLPNATHDMAETAIETFMPGQ